MTRRTTRPSFGRAHTLAGVAAVPLTAAKIGLAALLASVGIAIVLAPAAHAGQTKFCPHYSTWYPFPSGDTCTAAKSGEDGTPQNEAYHHLASVEMQSEYTAGAPRKCANYRDTINGGVHGDWVCDYGDSANRTIKYCGGNAGYGTVHNGDTYTYNATGYENF